MKKKKFNRAVVIKNELSVLEMYRDKITSCEFVVNVSVGKYDENETIEYLLDEITLRDEIDQCAVMSRDVILGRVNRRIDKLNTEFKNL
ncbi:MAG: hypothetical protein HQ522_16280 [Bacteroidetes bacterium]|nr:hypothetical protein [Bacteroidota bacterium]